MFSCPHLLRSPPNKKTGIVCEARSQDGRWEKTKSRKVLSTESQGRKASKILTPPEEVLAEEPEKVLREGPRKRDLRGVWASNV